MVEFHVPPSLGIYGNEKIATDLLYRIWGRRGLFTCTVANTKTSLIPGISDAGDTPELTMFTGPADAELLMNGEVTCMKGIPVNPGGIPTPATLTLAALELSGMPCYIVNGGCSVLPDVPYFEIGGQPGESVTTGRAVRNARKVYEMGFRLGRKFTQGNDFLVVSESCAGGTTTALAVMTAMGTVKENLVSSSSPNNPKELKTRTVAEGLAAAGIEPGSMADDPLGAIEAVGDPMMPANIGLICGAATRIPVIVGGGTQMGAVLASVAKLHPEHIGDICQGTTRWLMEDQNSSMRGILDAISPDIPSIYINMDYSESRYEGLQAYEWGYIKEGVGCGGACVGAVCRSAGRIDEVSLLGKVEEIYARITGQSVAP